MSAIDDMNDEQFRNLIAAVEAHRADVQAAVLLYRDRTIPVTEAGARIGASAARLRRVLDKVGVPGGDFRVEAPQ